MVEDYYDVRSLNPGETYVLRVVSVDGKQEAVSDAEEIRTYPFGMLDFNATYKNVILKLVVEVVFW